MAVLSGNTYVDGDLIVNGNVEVSSLTSQGVKFTQIIEDPEDNYLALTTADGNIKKSTVTESVAANGDCTYSLGNISTINTAGDSLTVSASSVMLDTPVDKITASNSSNITWRYADGTTAAYSSSNPSGAKGSNPKVFPISFSL